MKRILLIVITLLLAQAAFSQITNTRRWRKTEKDSLNNALLLYEENLYLMALPIFDDILRHHPNEEFIQYSFAKCGLDRSDKHEEAYKYLAAIYVKNKKVEDIDYDVARGAHYSNKLAEALTAINRYLNKRHLAPEKRAKAEILKRYINYAFYYTASPTSARITDMGDAINSEGEEYVPAITADESALAFTYIGPKSTGGLMNDLSQPDPLGVYHEDMYISHKKNNEFQTAEPLTNLNTDANDAGVSLSNDGSVLYIFRDNTDDHGDLYESHLVGDAYGTPTKLRGLVNSFSWDGHCSLSPDSKTLYFSSERGGGYGGKDIYRATLLPDSTWGNIVNLGDSVNTIYDDDAPFIHPDGLTLYFSTKGRTSMGGYDIFRSTMNPLDSTFKKTESLGYPINTADDDIYFVIAANNKNAYYSSGRSGGKGLKDIYVIDPAFDIKSPLFLVKGIVRRDSVGVGANITVENTSKNNAVYSNLMSNSSTGAYLVSLPAGSSYKLTYSLPGQPSQTLDIDALSITDYAEKVNDVKFVGMGTIASASTTVLDSAATAAAAAAATAAASNSVLIAKTSTVSEASSKTKDTFVPQNKNQAELVTYSDKYGDEKADSLEFLVQIGAFKNADNIVYPNLEGYGKVKKLPLEGGLTRITIGSSFKTLKKAFELNKKIIAAGQSDAFVIAIYKGRRVTLKELDGIYKPKAK